MDRVNFPHTAGLLLFTSILANAAVMEPDTTAAWEQYIGAVDARMRSASAERPFLWVDEEPSRVQRVRAGEVIASQVKPQIAQPVPHGLVHDWIGTAFIPGATLADVLAVARDYASYPKWYGPTITQADLLERVGGPDRVSMDRFTARYIRSALFVTVVLDTESEVEYVQVNATRCYSIARSTRVQEIHDYGKPEQRKMPPDDGSGYLWRLYSVAKYEQRDNGVYIEQETIALSRRIPLTFRWLVEPVVRRLSRNLLVGFLEQTREAVRSKSGNAGK